MKLKAVIMIMMQKMCRTAKRKKIEVSIAEYVFKLQNKICIIITLLFASSFFLFFYLYDKFFSLNDCFYS